jgi:hypothetical protein
MAGDQRPPYDSRDYEIMANNIFHELCELDRDDRGHERPPAWHDITVLADRLRAYDNRVDVAYLTETILHDERGFIVRDPKTNNVSLTRSGRANCNRRI